MFRLSKPGGPDPDPAAGYRRRAAQEPRPGPAAAPDAAHPDQSRQPFGAAPL